MSADPTNIWAGEHMFAHRSRPFKGLLTLVSALATIAVAGCGGGDETGTAQSGGDPKADRADVAVIESWSSTLREGDVRGAAEYFALPSVVQNGGQPITLESRADAVAFNGSLPCGAELISARTVGGPTRATFRLTDRPGGDCGAGAGERAATLFVIEDGEILEWRRITLPAPGPDGGTEGSLTGSPLQTTAVQPDFG
jgi:hypothetical protein